MTTGMPLPADVEVVPAAAGQEPIVANLLELYSHDFSEVIELQLGPDGRFGYPELPLYWHEEGRFPFLVRVDGCLAGVVLVTKGSRIGEDRHVWDMAEFFIVRGCRRQGIGSAVAHEIWRRFPGRWEVRVLERNQPARAFWEAAADAFTGGTAARDSVEREKKRWEVFSFESPKADSSTGG